MQYQSTRGGQSGIPSSKAITKGIAPDGGLFVPESCAKLTLEQITELSNMSYQELATKILSMFLSDYTIEELTDCVGKAYNSQKFASTEITPVHKVNDNTFVLELWHGPTCAFKDLALQIMPHLLVTACRKNNEDHHIVILVATSGDTGKAAMEGFKDVDGVSIIVFFPDQGVSEVQKLQMVTQEGQNVNAVAVRGNFDDVQRSLKGIFGDTDIHQKIEEHHMAFSSANSINWGRLAPQIVYYFRSYAELLKSNEITLGEKINFAVPSGNFGDILAGYYAIKMGLPVNKLICASNENNVLTDFINTGTYDTKRDFIKTNSPSMDIVVSSNLERLLFELNRGNPERLTDWMQKLSTSGAYTVDHATAKAISEIFWAGYSNDQDVLKTIECMYNEYNYLIDTHTAVAVDVYDKYLISTSDMTKTVIVATASPFKFNSSVLKAVAGEEAIEGKNEFELLEMTSKTCGLNIPEGLRNLDKKEIRHKIVCDKSEIGNTVMKLLKIG